ncbi:MAG TPA: hypothetical protein VN697_07565 [Tepidiformaceae bacterium]|nr:hypothetical protein [Tepidiformaceae bacterium]
MAVLIGDVTPKDEFMHPVSSDPHFSENMLFTFFARDGSHGGLIRIGNRVNEGHAEVTFLLFLPDGRTLFQFRRASITDNKGFDAAGVRFAVIEPTEQIHTSYVGPAIAMTDASALLDPGKAFKSSPLVDVKFDVLQQAVSALYLPMPFHYEQHMHAIGTLEVDGVPMAIDAFGVRDHTWGRRNWQATLCDRTLWCTLTDNGGFALSVTWHDETNAPEVMGSFVTQDEKIDVVEATVESTYLEDGVTHSAFTTHLRLANNENVDVAGKVLHLAPLRHRGPENTTYIGQGMSAFESGDSAAFGLSEYMDLLVNGRRALTVG